MADLQPEADKDDYKGDVEKIESELTAIKSRITVFEEKSASTIKADRATMLTELQNSVRSVEGTVLYLNSNDGPSSPSPASYALTSKIDSTTAVQALVSRHVEGMDATFTGLHAAASAGLERVEDIKKKCDDMEAELSGLRSRLSSLNKRAAVALASAKEALTTKTTEMEEAKKSLASMRAELVVLDDKVRHRKVGRNLLRGARVVTWSTTLLFPPAAVAAGGMEYAAHKIRNRLRQLHAQIEHTNSRLSNSSAEMALTESRVATLDKVLTEARSLGARVDTMEADSTGVKTLVDKQLREYQTVKESTDEFTAWTRAVADETAARRILGVDSRLALEQTTKKVIERLLEGQEGEVKSICATLQRLQIKAT